MPISCMADLVTAGQLIAQSGVCGQITPPEGFIVAEECHNTGMSIAEFSRKYNVMQGRISMKSDAMLARFNELGGKHKVIRRDSECAELELEWNGEKSRFALTIAEAQAEPFIYRGGPTKQMAELSKPLEKREIKAKYQTPRSIMQMLWARVSSDSVHVICPQANHGSYTPEEVSDFDDAPARGTDPIVISAEEAQSRVVETASTDTDEVDYTVCPIGGADYVGKSWSDMPTIMLEQALACKDPLMTQGHANVVIGLITTRKVTQQ